jgi:hypothetical protein
MGNICRGKNDSTLNFQFLGKNLSESSKYRFVRIPTPPVRDLIENLFYFSNPSIPLPFFRAMTYPAV